MSVKEGDQIDSATAEKVQQRQSQQYSSGIELDTEKRRATFNKVYRRPNLNVCKEHLFCDRQQCQLSFAPEEQNPLMQSFMAQMKRDTKKEDKSHSEYLRKPFYYRGIQNKKKQLAAGQIQPKDFEDDNIEFYGFELKKEKDQYLRENYLDEDCPGSVKWQEDSYKFAEKLKKQTQLRQAQSNRKMQPTMQQSTTQNMANIGSPNVQTGGPNSSIGLQTQLTMQQTFEPSSAITKLESTFIPNAGGIMSPEPRIDRAGSIIAKKGTGPSSSVGDKKDDGSEKKGSKNKCVQLEDKCCNSTYHQLKPKHQKIKQIVTLTREEQLGKQTKVIHDKSQYFLDRSIGKSMRWSFFPVVPKKTEDPVEEEFLYKKKFGGNAVNQRLAHLREQHEQEYMNGQTFYKTNTSFMAQDTRKSIKSVKVDQSLDSKEATATLERTKSLMSGNQGAAHGSMPSIPGTTSNEIGDGTSPPKRKFYAQERMQDKANQELQERMSKEWEFKRAQQLQKENKDFLFKMHYRHVGQIEKNNDYANQAGVAGPKITKCKDFSDVIEASNLNILTQAELDEANMLYGGITRENMQRLLTDKAHTQTKSPNMLQQEQIRQQKRFLEPENLENIKQCKNILKNQKLYAETILVNAKTGKQLKQSSSFYNANSSRTKNFRGSKSTGGRAGKTTFQQYQDPLFSGTSNQQIASILNQSKRYQISQMKEEFGIMNYIKKKYYQEHFQGKGDILENKQLLEEIKNKYFKDITDEEFTRARIEEQLAAEQAKEDNPSAVNDQSQTPENQDQMSKQLVMSVQKRMGYVKENTREIYENILRNNEGLNFRQGRVKPYQFEDENFISNQMMGQEAVDQELKNIKGIGKRDEEQNVRAEPVIRSNNSPQVVEVSKPGVSSNEEENNTSSISPIKGKKINSYGRNVNNQTNDSITTDDELKKLSAYKAMENIDEKNTNVEENSQNESVKQTNRKSALKRESINNSQSNDPAETARKQQHAPNSVFYNKNYKETKSVQHVYLDSDYWYHKGVVLTGMNENDYALNCYRQALLLKQDHEPSIFNLACSYEKLEKYEDALESFTAAIECRENWPDAHYGLALCCLKLKRNQEAVNHIENAKKWSIEEYENKVRQRNKRRRQRQKEMQEAINLGNAQPPMKTGDDTNQNKENSQNNMLDNAELCPEDDDSQDEFYIDPATQKNGGVSTHIMYVRALCHREIKAYRVALESYAKVMKREQEICDYEKMIERVNFQQLQLKAVEGPCSIGWKVDLYSHFKRLKLLKENNPVMMVDLRQYYTWKDGWDHDKIPDVIKKLQLIRFFNRFDSETLYQMMKKTDLKVIKKHNLLFLEPDQCAIVINGNLNLFSHKDEVATPILQGIYTPGDIIGNSSIDNGWSRQTHSWIIAYKDCDIVIINKEYVNYLWDKMKSSSDLNYMATKIKASKCFEGMTEQSIYTIAFDVMYYQRFDNSEQNCKICPQYTKSHWNVDFIKKQNRARKNFADKMISNPEFKEAFQIFQKEKYPRVDEMMKKRYAMKEYHDELLKELNRREFKYGKKKKKKTIQEEQDAESLKEKEKDKEQNDEDGENAEEEEKFDKRKLNLPRFDEKLTDKELEEEKDIRKQREPKYGEMVDLSEEMEKICQGLKTVGVKLTQQLEDYKHAKDNYPKDAQGFFILLEGQITIKNDYALQASGKPVDLYGGQPTSEQKFSRHGDKTTTQKSDRPEQMDVFGAEKFLQVQGYTYYGCAYSTTEKKDGGTVCGFLREDLLYLIPFYDLYRLKTDIEKRYQNRCERLKKVCSDKYNPILKKEMII